jgi:hypothetical protein
VEQQDPWAHAGSIENERMLDDKIAELRFMRDLFDNVLPVGKEREHYTKYFNDLETLIYTKDDIKHEEFIDEPNPDGSKRDYKYLSSSLLKERSKLPAVQPDARSMDDSDCYIDRNEYKLPSQDSQSQPF